MFSRSKLLLTLACFVLSCLYVNVDKVASEEYLVDFVSEKRLHIQFPQYGSVTTINSDLLKVNKEHISNIIAYVRDVAGKSLSGVKTNFWKTAGELINLYKARKSAVKDINTKVGTKGQYNKDMRGMFQRMMKMSKKEEPNYKNSDPLELKKAIEDLMDGLIEAINVSPVANYFDFSKGRVNGEAFEVHVSKLMAQLSNNGFGGLLKAVDTLLAWIVKLSIFG